MTGKTSPDILDLAEAVARGDMQAADAERTVRAGVASGPASDRAVRELRGLISAAGAVRSHAQATRHAGASASAAGAHSDAAIGTVVAGPVGAGSARRHPSNGGAGQPRRRTWLLAVAALLVGAGVIGASLLGSGVVTPTSPPTLSPANVVAVTSPSPATLQSPDTAPPVWSDPVNGPRSMLLASDTVGWMGTPSAMYRTRDMGETWTEVQPTGWSTTAIVRYVDADTTYATREYIGPDGGPLTIAATHDGGTSWIEATIDTPPNMANVGFSYRTPENAFATLFSADGKDVRVFETTDGGRTWTGPVRSSAPRMLYLLKDLSGDVASGQHALVLTNALAPGRPFDNNVYFSVDGGVTWVKRPFPVSERAPAAEMKGATLWADGSGRIVLAMSVNDDLQMYTSDDDGLSWLFVRDLGRDAGRVQLLSATEWIFANGSQVVSTVDGGATWRTTQGASRIFPYEYSFASPDHGWALLTCFYYPAEGYSTYCAKPQPGVNDTTVVFLTTTDGGRTWTRTGG